MVKTKNQREKFRVVFTVTCGSNDTLSGLVQTEDENEREKRVLLDDSGTAEMKLPAGRYTFVWSVKMTPVQRHRYSITAERLPVDGDPEELCKRASEQTTTRLARSSTAFSLPASERSRSRSRRSFKLRSA